MREILDLTAVEQAQLFKRLKRYALRRMMRLTWRGAHIRYGGSVPKGYEPEDFVNDALRKVLAGKRNWNKAKYPTLERFLCSVIRSDISHMVESVDNAAGRRQQAVNGTETIDCDFPDRDGDPLIVVFESELKARLDQAMTKELANDPFLRELLQCIRSDITEPSEIAILMSVSVDEVNNGKKKLARRLAELDTRIKPKRKTK